MTEDKEISPVEIQIPVPWGHIAGKVWGKTGDQCILAIHGKQDNCGVFDRLISLFKGNYNIICIDLPGHGFSSHFPSGIPLYFLNFVIAIAYVVKEIQWNRFILLGHSIGGQIGLFFTAIYPEYIQKLIVIDHISPMYVDDNQLVINLRKEFDDFVKLQNRLQNGTPPIYTYNEVLEKLINRESALSTEAAKIVLKRSLLEKENGYSFCMDQRIKTCLFPSITSYLVKDVVCNVNCPTLFLFSTERMKFYEKSYNDIFTLMKKKSNIIIKVVPGNHDVHQNHPERVVKLIEEFIIYENCKL